MFSFNFFSVIQFLGCKVYSHIIISRNCATSILNISLSNSIFLFLWLTCWIIFNNTILWLHWPWQFIKHSCLTFYLLSWHLYPSHYNQFTINTVNLPVYLCVSLTWPFPSIGWLIHQKNYVILGKKKSCDYFKLIGITLNLAKIIVKWTSFLPYFVHLINRFALVTFYIPGAVLGKNVKADFVLWRLYSIGVQKERQTKTE